MIKVYNSGNVIQTNQIVQTLEENGVPACKKDIGAGGYLSTVGNLSYTGADIYVNEEDEEKAREIIEMLTGEELDAEKQSNAEKNNETVKMTVIRVIALVLVIVKVLGIVLSAMEGLLAGYINARLDLYLKMLQD